MNRTRIVFFSVLLVFLAIVAVSLGTRLISEGSAMQLFVACTVFAVGVVTLDFLGILGHEGDGDGGDGLDMGEVHAGDDLAMDGHDIHDAGHDGGHDSDHGHHGHSPVLSVLTYLRLLVYFSLGFGPTGWVGMATGRSALVSLVLASAMGVLALMVAQAFFRFQRSDTDSSLGRDDLLMAEATVLVPLTSEAMGKVRVQVGMSVTEQYALAAQPGARFAKGERVQITRVTDECVFVL
jgi:membrane protein implicated in regulation of membrane protease activity